MDVEALRDMEAPIGVGRPLSSRVTTLSRAGWLALALGCATFPAPAPGAAKTVAAMVRLEAHASQASESASREAEPRDAAPPGSELTIYLLTFGQGDAIWEPFGHNAIWIQDHATGRDLAYNWGIIDLRRGDFIPRFLKGRMLYSMEGHDVERMIEPYRYYNRSIWRQELNLTPRQRLELKELIEVNARPENRDYLYDYFRDNCSTRPRDLLDRVLGGRLRQTTADVPGGSYRFHTRRLTEHDLVIWTGLDLLLGNRGDRPISRWEAMFVPMEFQRAIREVTVIDGEGRETPLVLREETVFTADREPERSAPSGFRWAFLLTGLLIGAAVLALARPTGTPRRASRIGLGLLAGGWSLIAGVVGLVLVLVLFTNHVFMYWNENVLQYNPLSLALVVAAVAVLFGRRPPRWALGIALLVALLSALGFVLQALPGLDQGNAEHIALALPIHAAWAFALARLRADSGAAAP